VAKVALEGVSKIYPDGTRAVDHLDITVGDGELLVLVGPSGCGKTTALRMIAGLEDITEGQVRIGDRVVNDVPSRDRDVAMVFQNYALYPHLTVAENIAFGLKLRKVPKEEIGRRVQEAAETLGLTDYLKRKPRALSGGQRQRVAMGRAIVRQPQAFLMDEPLSNLDAKLRVQVRAEIARIQHSLQVTTVYVTHDQVEAMTLGDRVAVMNHGVLQQVAPPQELYDHPTNLFVGGFIGSPSMNLFETNVERDDASVTIAVGDQRLAVNSKWATMAGRHVIAGIRPEDMEDASLTAPTPDRTLKAKVELVEAMGADVLVHFNVDAPAVLTEDEPEVSPVVGTPMVARVSPRTKAREGEPLQLAVDTEGLHLFDPESGLALNPQEAV
jgi:multiple sugar transport system ATP-binding protein